MKSKKRVRVPDPAADASVPEKADVVVAQAVAPHREHGLVRLLDMAGKLGDQPPLRTISAMAIAGGLAGGNPRLARAGARMLLAHEIATLVKNVVKGRIDRTRPNVLTKEGRYRMEPGRRKDKEETSFPSGHSAGSVAVASAFAREYPEYRGAVLAAAGVVALAQIPRCAHYPTDVAAGATIGVIADMVAARVTSFP